MLQVATLKFKWYNLAKMRNAAVNLAEELIIRH